jgi:hypothetical protein
MAFVLTKGTIAVQPFLPEKTAELWTWASMRAGI